MNSIKTIDEKALLNLYKGNADNFENYKLSVMSIDRRIRYCEYHHSECNRLLKNAKLGFMTRDPKSGLSDQMKYEAHSLNHMQLLHSLVDSTPYILYLLNQPSTPKEHSVSLDHSTIEAFKNHSIDTTHLKKILDDDVCKTLRAYINLIKHRYIFKMRYEVKETGNVFISAIKNEHLSINSPEQPLNEYIENTHNHIVFDLIIDFYNRLTIINA